MFIAPTVDLISAVSKLYLVGEEGGDESGDKGEVLNCVSESRWGRGIASCRIGAGGETDNESEIDFDVEAVGFR